MKILSILTVAFILTIVLLVIILSRHGLFEKVIIKELKKGPYLLVFKKHVGDYKNVGPVMDQLYEDLKNNYSIETTKGFGLYYDNPKKVSREKLRSIVGCIVEGKELKDLLLLKEAYGVSNFPESECVTVEFPYKGNLSIILGILKVYPKLGPYLEDRKNGDTPIMELYDVPGKKIEYIASVGLEPEIFQDLLAEGK